MSVNLHTASPLTAYLESISRFCKRWRSYRKNTRRTRSEDESYSDIKAKNLYTLQARTMTSRSYGVEICHAIFNRWL